MSFSNSRVELVNQILQSILERLLVALAAGYVCRAGVEGNDLHLVGVDLLTVVHLEGDFSEIRVQMLSQRPVVVSVGNLSKS